MTPRLDVWEKMKLGLLGDPGRLLERGDQLPSVPPYLDATTGLARASASSCIPPARCASTATRVASRAQTRLREHTTGPLTDPRSGSYGRTQTSRPTPKFLRSSVSSRCLGTSGQTWIQQRIASHCLTWPARP